MLNERWVFGNIWRILTNQQALAIVYGGCLLSCLLVLTACTFSAPRVFPVTDPTQPAARGHDQVGTSPELPPYYLQVGDVIEVKFFYSPELNEKVTIRPDGKISLQLVGEIPVVGLTPAKLQEILVQKYTGILRQPEVAVIIREFVEQKVYIGGEVNAPGALVLKGKLTVLQAVMRAGGFKHSAELRNVVILRNSGSRQLIFISLNLKDHLELAAAPECKPGEEGSGKCRNERAAELKGKDIPLEPFDVVFVPQTRIARVAEFFDKYINRILPIYGNMGLTFQYDIRDEVRVETR